MPLIFIDIYCLNLAFRQCKLHNIFIFGMAHFLSYFSLYLRFTNRVTRSVLGKTKLDLFGFVFVVQTGNPVSKSFIIRHHHFSNKNDFLARPTQCLVRGSDVYKSCVRFKVSENRTP